MWARIAGSSASGMPALTSSMWAPAATCASTSRSTRLKSPAFISSARALRPVGLMRSPMMTNGRSKPSTTSRVAELRTVSVMRRVLGGHVPTPWDRRLVGRGEHRAALDAAGLDQLGEPVFRVVGLEALGLGRHDGLDVVAAAVLLAAPLLDVVVVGALARAGGGLVDGHLEPRVEDLLALAAPLAREDLGRDVAPPDHGHHAHRQRTAVMTESTWAGPAAEVAAAIEVASSPKPVRRSSKRSPRRRAPRRAAATRAGSSVWAR